MLKKFFVLFFVCSFSNAQVINIESLRKPSDSTKWSGSASLDIGLIKNVNSIFRIANKVHIQYTNKKNLWLFINDLNFQKLEGNSFVNRGTQHLRYNYKLAKKLKLEAFTQAQYDAISQIDFRGLIGIGPRYKLSSNDNYRFYVGTLIMYEYEKPSNDVIDKLQKDIRGSAYLSFSLYPTKTLSIISTSYYQPKLKAFKDYRFSSDTSILFKIYKDLAFKTNFNYRYDRFPITGITKAQYELTNGLLYTF
ncbi:DUF481 domain-containing protein [Ichthyenterobacterium magnum]|uniref:Uncharacterized protein DUF481 n=1 Tax=Ichthyenterobacterium magnum TaxID=1230530 RepID=A0A420DEU6_9FLAO|nr:DUF481 domain-containing protein [Ichthyenterobacterium magnum]RKE90925.1 uncharacterized protein DUF481 [Ichthyenterobacterium magnum]